MPRGAKNQKAAVAAAMVGGLVENAGADMDSLPPTMNADPSASGTGPVGVRGKQFLFVACRAC
jgi:hypothetical protein